MWLDQVATKTTEAKVCMSVVGHTSRTGSQEFNDTLSKQRGTFIREQLIAKSAVLADRTRPDGKGYRENIVGSGTDNAVDALDRRVEFKVNPC
jgi:outer membrane protein OmpA-like peptidoglycan-associated protein